MVSTEQLNRLRIEIASCAAVDKYLDEDEERQLFSRARQAGLDDDTVEAVINQMCHDKRWTREKEIVADLNRPGEGASQR